MADNITGFGSGADEISLGLNLNSNVGNSINDFNTLDQVLQQMNKDGEIFNGIQSDSFEKAKAATQELRSSGEAAQQLISIFRALRGEQQGILGDAKQLTSVYQQFNNELSKSQQTQARMGITSAGAGPSIPGSSPGAQPINTSSPSTQAGSSGGGGRGPIVPGQGAGFAEEPDDFFGREEIKSGGGRGVGGPSGIDIPGLDASDLQDFEFEGGAGGFGGAGKAGMARKATASNEQYKQFSDLALSIFPGQGYYSRLRKARWLARNENGAISKFTESAPGRKMGMALNRLGGGQNLRIDGGTKDGYQLFPFAQDENGKWIDADNKVVGSIDDNGNIIGGKYGLQDSAGTFLKQGGEGLEQPTWAWSGSGPPPTMPGQDQGTPQPFDPWQRPNLSATGEGAAKIGGAVYAAKMIQAKGGDLFREGQLYTGLTGGTGITGALKYDIGAQATSWFGLNPLEGYGQAKQITMQNLSLGYRGNLLNQANSFGNQALQKYGVDPNTSMQMFGQIVMQAGASLQDLNTSLATLAHTASTTDTSFSQLQQNVIQYSQLGASIGLTGGQNATFATAAAQYAAGQPGLGATGANPADILDSMVGQALVAQQMGTSFLGLPAASSQQGAAGVLKGEISANESLINRIGLNKGNYQDSDALQGAYQKFKLLMSSLGMKKQADMSYTNYVKYIGDMFNGKQVKELKKTLTSTFAQDMGQKAGESAGKAIANASFDVNGLSSSTIVQDMQKIESQDKWKNIGVMMNGKFKGLADIATMPARERDALYAKISTGDTPLSHINQHGKLIKGNYSNSTLLDKEGHSAEQTNLFGRTPNRAAMQKAEYRAMTIELGPNAQQIFTLLDKPGALNKYLNNFNNANGKPISSSGNSLRAPNPPKK